MVKVAFRQGFFFLFINLISLFEKSAQFSSIELAAFIATGSFPLALLAYEAIDSSLSPSRNVS